MDSKLDNTTELLYRSVTHHLDEVNMTYTDHMARAFSLSFSLISTGIQTFIHGIFPFVFTRTATDKIKILYHDVIADEKRRRKLI